MKQKVLIVTERNDTDADLVILRIRERGELPIRVNFDDPELTNAFTVRLLEGGMTGVLRTKNRQVLTEDVGSVYCRAPLRSPAFPVGTSLNDGYAHYEANCAWEAMWSVLDCYWMNSPVFVRGGAWRPKFFRLAQSLGIATVPTLVTSSPAEVRRFAEQHAGKLVFRPIGARFLPAATGDNEPQARQWIGPTLISPALFEQHAKLISNGPCLFQQYIEKRRELRIVVVQDKVFVAAVESTDDPPRRPMYVSDPASIKLIPATITPEFRSKCIMLVREAGLGYAILDVAETAEGRHLLLELNPHGSFSCFEHHLRDLKVADAVASALLEARQR